MGSCISKCRPRRHMIDELNHVQDKLVISQAPSRLAAPPISASNKISPSPPSPSNSTSSASSFTCTTNTSTSHTSSSLTSTLSSASSVLSSKIDRSFSNEFLWSCYKENPHVVRINSLKEASFSSSSLPQKPLLPAAVKKKQPNLKNANASVTPQKRMRSSSPTPLTRQKSFRKEPERPPMISAYSHPSRILRSPSPSRRFNMANPPKESSHSKPNAFNLRPAASSNYSNSSRLLRPCLRSRETETRIHRISSKIDEVAVGEALADYMDSLPAEDIDNPLISLDCFIFL
ncbi:segmentation polarity homeobox protein engrailed [Prunus avium]|uniref:Segmentation polarity homeobox protein engrailed n=1 Tax=Prunus avium TaxID=42229 RepID=A0A6P5SQY2_PRUAV|nr:segmentation polarity homeobox protein engrailed [Prunus avium]